MEEVKCESLGTFVHTAIRCTGKNQPLVGRDDPFRRVLGFVYSMKLEGQPEQSAWHYIPLKYVREDWNADDIEPQLAEVGITMKEFHDSMPNSQDFFNLLFERVNNRPAVLPPQVQVDSEP